MELTPINIVELTSLLLWFSLVVAVLIVFYKPIRHELLPRLGGLNVMGVEFAFVEDSIDAAIELAEKNPQWKVEILPTDKKRVLNRAKQHLDIFRQAQILWVDDHPEHNVNERRMFRQLGAEIDIAKSTDEALEMLRNHGYDLVVSDMTRGDQATAGLDLLRQLRRDNKTAPVIFYIGVVDPEKGVPAQAFGITNRPDELLHLTLDALERGKY